MKCGRLRVLKSAFPSTHMQKEYEILVTNGVCSCHFLSFPWFLPSASWRRRCWGHSGSGREPQGPTSSSGSLWQPSSGSQAPAVKPQPWARSGLWLLGVELVTHFRASLRVTPQKVLFGSRWCRIEGGLGLEEENVPDIPHAHQHQGAACARAASGLVQISLAGIFTVRWFHLSQWWGGEAGSQIRATLALICEQPS